MLIDNRQDEPAWTGPVPRPNLESIKPYKPGKPIEQVVRELKLRGPVDKLASNENPLGPSPKALNALRKELKNLHYYPEDSCHVLRDKLAKRWKVPMDAVLVGNGSVEIILQACLSYLGPETDLVTSAGAFIMAKVGTMVTGARCIEVPTEDYRHDLDRILENVTERTRIVYLDNPMNPLGTIVTRKELDKFVSRLPEHVLLIVDEAYAEYITNRFYPKSLDYVKRKRNVLMLRTFSKVYGLAGLRVGYGITRPELALTIGKVRLPFNVNRAAQVAAAAALDDTAHAERSRKLVEAGKKTIYAELKRLQVFHIPSSTNFVLANFAVDSSVVFEGLQRRGVITRPVKQYGFPNALRVTIGDANQNKRFLKALAAVLEELKTQ
jgi:histidinol-phosphate aminotransferase